jgi:glycosyltransferase involved in cell wall biosynthesis
VISDFELHTFTFNEEFMLPKLVKWYRKRMPDIRIVVHDNESTDKTEEIATSLGCEVIPFSTNGHLRNKKLRQLKNSVWKGSKAGFVIVADIDEMLDVDANLLSTTDATIIRGVGINMVGNTREIEEISQAGLSSLYDKMICFNPSAIKSMNYSPGAHWASPKGIVKFIQAPLYHYKWISAEYVIERTRLVNPRRSRQDKFFGWGIHYEMKDADIKREHLIRMQKAVSVFPSW